MKFKRSKKSWDNIGLSEIIQSKSDHDDILFSIDVFGWNNGQKQEEAVTIIKVLVVLNESGDEYELNIESKFFIEELYRTNKILQYRDTASTLSVDKVTEYIESNL